MRKTLKTSGKPGRQCQCLFQWQRPANVKVVKRNFLYSAVSSPPDRSKRCTLFALPGRPVHSDTNLASPGSILAMQQLRAMTKSLTRPSLSIARYSFIHLSQQGHQWRERKYPIFETEAKGIRTRAHLIASLSFYRAPYYYRILQTHHVRTHVRTDELSPAERAVTVGWNRPIE